MADRIGKFNVVHRLEKRALLIGINCIAGLAIFFFGYDQGMMGSVNVSINYGAEVMKFGHVANGQLVVDNTLKQGGITSVYYVGTLVGCLLGGWTGEKIGRIKTLGLACVWAIFGASLQTAAQNANWMICARCLNGVGTGILNVIVPVWATETAAHTSRGQFVAIEFTNNILGVVVAYWIGFGCSFYKGGLSSFCWRFVVAFQIVPLLFLFAVLWFFPESPRWLVKVGRLEEARYILGRLRGETGDDEGLAEAEFQDICNVAEMEKSAGKINTYFHMFWDVMPKKIGGGSTGHLHIGRRVQLVVWLQILQEWIGIAGVTVYANDIFRTAGYTTEKARWLAGLNDVFYMFSTLVAVFTLDRLGRRVTLYWGCVVQGISMFLSGGLSRVAINAGTGSARAATFGAASAAFTFVFTAAFGATWLTVPWLYPAEIFPLQVRAKGNAWGVVGWSIGNGWTILLIPIMFGAIEEKTFYIFGAVNAISIPIVWALYPESNQRTLEEMDLLFASDSWWNWDAETNFARLKEEHPDLVQAATARRRSSMIDPETGLKSRKSSYTPAVAKVRDDSPGDSDEKPKAYGS